MHKDSVTPRLRDCFKDRANCLFPRGFRGRDPFLKHFLKPPASSVYVHVLETSSPLKRSIILIAAQRRSNFQRAVREPVDAVAMSHLPENPCVFRGNRTVTGRKLEKHGPKKFDLLCAAISSDVPFSLTQFLNSRSGVFECDLPGDDGHDDA